MALTVYRIDTSSLIAALGGERYPDRYLSLFGPKIEAFIDADR